MKPIVASDFAGLTVQQRIRLVEEIWDSIAENPESVVVPDWHRQELEKRLEISPDAEQVVSWKEVKKGILE